MRASTKQLVSSIHPSLYLSHPTPDCFAWNTVIKASPAPALLAYLRMRRHCVRPDLYTFPFLLQPLSSPSHLPSGRLLHAHALLFGLFSDTLWHGRSQESLALFDQMLSRSMTPNAVTFLGVLCACVHGGLVEEGREYFDRMSLEFGIAPLIQHHGCIVDLYGRAGMINQAWEVVRSMPMKGDVLIWGALLCACVHGGLVEEGREYFDKMSLEFGIAPLIQHYGCIFDLYGRAGMINQAWEVVRSMPMKGDVLIWGALLSGSRLHGDRETCELALKNLIELEPLNSGAHVLLSNLYAKMGK
ncbi:hypothetical protein Taro_038571 [Colocasia esculenta]|uniref:Pentatricopeptide repeat-containing protein n=1 Tax=Colocasia esculenta TaxID=4460 RepID=A0A843W728_COLES|nr:hypothetical protein [Colocasia esculenta]